MARLTAEMKEAFLKMKIFPVATASKDGTPNVIPIGVVELVSDDTIWITDNFMNKTLENLRANPKIAVCLGRRDQRVFPDQGACHHQDKRQGVRGDEGKAQQEEPGPACALAPYRQDHRCLRMQTRGDGRIKTPLISLFISIQSVSFVIAPKNFTSHNRSLCADNTVKIRVWRLTFPFYRKQNVYITKCKINYTRCWPYIPHLHATTGDSHYENTKNTGREHRSPSSCPRYPRTRGKPCQRISGIMAIRHQYRGARAWYRAPFCLQQYPAVRDDRIVHHAASESGS